jgi:hypothetical protein
VLHGTEHITVTNAGNAAIEVTSRSLTLRQSGHGCGISDPAGWMTMNPRAFRLAPGHSRVVSVTVNAPKTATGTTDLLAVFTATGHATGNGRLSGSVASQVIVNATGTPHVPVCGHQALPASHASGIPAAAVLGGGLAVLFVIVFAAVVAFRRYRPARPN